MAKHDKDHKKKSAREDADHGASGGHQAAAAHGQPATVDVNRDGRVRHCLAKPPALTAPNRPHERLVSVDHDPDGRPVDEPVGGIGLDVDLLGAVQPLEIVARETHEFAA